MLANQFDVFLFDLDGTLYHGEEILPHVKESLFRLRSAGKMIRFVTNDPRPTRAEVTKRLTEMGIEVQQQEVFTSGWATARYLGESGVRSAYVVGSPGLTFEIRQAEVEVFESGQPETVVVGGDERFCYDHLLKATRLILGGARFVATNPDGSYPTSEGPIPGAGAIVAAVQAVTGEAPVAIIGKPNPKLFELALEGLDAKSERVAMVGDNPLTDILGALRVGITGILIAKAPPLSSRNCEVPTPDVTIPDLSFLFDPHMRVRTRRDGVPAGGARGF